MCENESAWYNHRTWAFQRIMSYTSVPGTPDGTSIGSGGNWYDPLVQYFGPPNQHSPLDLDIEGKNPQVTHNLPLAFWGKSTALEDVMEFRVTGANEFYTSELLPYEKTANPNLQWMVFRFNKSYFEIEPFGGNPNYITSEVEAHSEKMLQRGMAFMIAHGFWQTDMGRQQYQMNLEIIENSVRLTVYHMVIMALLKAKNVYRNWEIRFRNPSTTIPSALKRMKARWAILNKGMHEFRKFVADVEEVLQSNGANPNILVLPPKSKILMAHAHESEYDYDKSGPISQNVRKNGQSAYDVIRGLRVYETTTFNEVMFGQNYNPLRRVREYGSFFWITNYHRGSHLHNYRNEERFAAKVLDASKDGQETKISGSILFRLSQRFDNDGKLSKYHHDLTVDSNINDLKKRMQASPADSYIDMFVGYDPSRDPQNPYYVMDYLGEMWDHDVRKDQIKDFATTASNKFLSREDAGGLNSENLRMIDDADRFMEGLNKVDLSDLQQRAYWGAVALSVSVDGAENKGTGDIAKDNGFGCIWPPAIIDAADPTKRTYTLKAATEARLIFGHKEGKFVAIPSTAVADGSDAAAITAAIGIDSAATGREINASLAAPSGKHEKDGATYFRAWSSVPYGFGHPTGLATLANMHKTGNKRGYSESVLKEAAAHYATMEKFHSIWKHIFPEHELGAARACPFYFRTQKQTQDELTAFGLNLYGYAKYPVFGAAKKGGAAGYVFGFDATGTADLFDDLPAKNVLATKVKADFTDAPTGAAIEALLNAVIRKTDSLEIREAMQQEGTYSRMKTNYRSKPYILKGKTYSLADFIKLIADMSANEDTKAKVLTTIFELLLRDGKDEPMDWDAFVQGAMNRPVYLASLKSKNVPVTAPKKITAYNTRLVIHPSTFRQMEEALRSSATKDDGTLDFARAPAPLIEQIKSLPVLPMNVFNPTVPVALYTDAANGSDISADNNTLLQLKYASSIIERNTISSLTTSPLFESHLSASAHASRGGKRSFEEDSFAPSQAFPKRYATTGGVFPGDYTTPNKKLYHSIPAVSAYDSTLSAYDTQGAIPMHVAQDGGFDVFNTSADHTRHYRAPLVSRFHEWGHETNAMLRILAQSWITSKIHLKTFENWWVSDCLPLVSFEVWRPRQRYYMGSGFIAEGGRRLGNVFHGFHDFQWTDDIIRKVHVGHYTAQFAAVVKDPKLYALCEDIVAMGYISGEDVSFCAGPSDWNALATDPSNATGSMVVKMVPYNRDTPESPQDIGGRWNQTIVVQTSTEGMSTQNPVHGESAYFYNHIFKFDRLNTAMVQRDPVFHNPQTSVNTVCWLGHHRIYDPSDKNWSGVIMDDGPFGPNAYKGVISDRDGRAIKDIGMEKTNKIFS